MFSFRESLLGLDWMLVDVLEVRCSAWWEVKDCWVSGSGRLQEVNRIEGDGELSSF